MGCGSPQSLLVSLDVCTCNMLEAVCGILCRGKLQHSQIFLVYSQVPACDPSTFFPVEVNFTATKTLCDTQVRICCAAWSALHHYASLAPA